MALSARGPMLTTEKEIDYLELKKLVLAQLSSAEQHTQKESFQDLSEKAGTIGGEEFRTKIKKGLDGIAKSFEEAGVRSRELASTEHKIEELRVRFAADQENAKLVMAAQDRHEKYIRSFFERESVATMVGGIIFIVFAVAVVTAMFMPDTKVTPIIDKGFFALLGYFFGQASGKVRRGD